MNSNPNLKKFRPLIIAAIVITPYLFFIGSPEDYSPRSLKHAWNMGHIIYFAILPLAIILCINIENIKSWHQISIAFGMAVVFGTLLELFQSSFGRTFDVFDLMRNVIGAMVGVSFICPVRRVIPGVIKLLTLGLVATQLYPIAEALSDEYHMRRDFPILSDFETPFQIQRWEGSATMSVVKDIGSTKSRALKAVLPITKYPGVSLKYFLPDWHLYKRFQFKVYSPYPKPLSLTCRIHDEAHEEAVQHFDDRFNKTFQINSGWNTISIDLIEVGQAPKNRLMDLTSIRGIIIFAVSPALPLTIYIDDLRLI